MRKKWVEEDEDLYAGKYELEATQESLLNTNQRIDEVHRQLSDFEKFSAEFRNHNEVASKALDDKISKLDAKAVDALDKLEQAKTEMS